jgi:branched-subunit amino acid ABC-type transport system permease component
LIAIGYTMVYGIIGMINFAHGEVYMIGSYVAFMVMAGAHDDGHRQHLSTAEGAPSWSASSSPAPMAGP